MKRKILFAVSLPLILLIAAACSPTTEPAAEVAPVEEVVEEAPAVVEEQPAVEQVAEEPPTPTAVPIPTDTPAPAPTNAPAVEETAAEEVVEEESIEEAVVEAEPEAVVEAEPEAAASEIVFGRTEEGAFFYGAPDAEITLIDYSDFL
ncbi:MAG: hypothetical protein AAGD96_33450 [Chloroflexota bacterium]